MSKGADLALTPIEIGLTAAIVAVEAEAPSILVTGERGRPVETASLPTGPFDPLTHGTFEMGLRAWVEAQTGLRVGYAEQLYTFGDRGRHTQRGDTHVVSVGYLALTRLPRIRLRCAQPVPASSPGTASFPGRTGVRNGPPSWTRPSSHSCANGRGDPQGRACAGARARGAVAPLLRRRRQPVGRGEGARPLRAPLRGGPRRGGAPRRPRGRACA